MEHRINPQMNRSDIRAEIAMYARAVKAMWMVDGELASLEIIQIREAGRSAQDHLLQWIEDGYGVDVATAMLTH